MAHFVEPETITFADKAPWHKLGHEVSNNMTPAEMMVAAKVNWSVQKINSYAPINGKLVGTGQTALVRSDTGQILANVTKTWNPVQNIEAFEFFKKYVLAGDMEMSAAGSLNGGRIVWVLAKVKESFDLFRGDQVDLFLLFSNPHQYGKSIDIRFTPIRIVCNNALPDVFKSRTERAIKISHHAPFDAGKVKKKLIAARTKFTKYKEMAEFLGSKHHNKNQLRDYYGKLFPTDPRRNDKSEGNLSGNAQRCLELIEEQPGHLHGKGTWWQAFNAVTYFTDHIQGKSEESRLHSQWYGANERLKIKAAKLAVKFAKLA